MRDYYVPRPSTDGLTFLVLAISLAHPSRHHPIRRQVRGGDWQKRCRGGLLS